LIRPSPNRFLEHSEKRVLSPGIGGVEAYPNCYGSRYEYCGWDIVGGSNDIPPFYRGIVEVLPVVAEHFDPKSVYMFGIDPDSPSTNMRFTIAAITAGGQPQYANNKVLADGTGPEILSDSFNRSDQPIMVNNWSVISTAALGAALKFEVFNLNAQTIRIFITLWGNAMPDWFVRTWQEADREDKSIYVVKTEPIEAPWAYRLLEEDNKTKERRIPRLLPGFMTRPDPEVYKGALLDEKRVKPRKRGKRRRRGRRSFGRRRGSVTKSG